MAKCPFTLLENPCPRTNEGENGCELWHEATRVLDATGETLIVKACVFNLDHDERRNQTQRLAMMQSEMGATKHAALFQGLAMLADSPEIKHELYRLIKAHAPGDIKALME